MKYLIITLVLISSCSKDYRATRKISKLQSWGYLKTDSVTIRDTIQGFDTLIVRQFDTLSHTDTLEVLKDGVKVKTIIRWRDRIIEQQITKRDTIVETKFVRTEVIKPTKVSWWYNFGKHFLLIFIVMSVVSLILSIIIMRGSKFN